MIFFTVGTHEQPFDRAVEAVDLLKKKNIITDEVFIQTGYSNYKPRHCDFEPFITYPQMMEHMEKARMVITHGGTGSIMLVLYHNKIPVVIPRQNKHNEHIDDHQVDFCRLMEEKGKLLAVYETEELPALLENYEIRVEAFKKKSDGAVIGSLTERAGIIAKKLEEILQDWKN